MTYEQQIQKLKGKGMIIDDTDAAKTVLQKYSYFALITGYKDLFKNHTTNNYVDGTTLDDIVAIYEFDAGLRKLTFSYLLSIEQRQRSLFSYAFCDIFGDSQTAYTSSINYNCSSPVLSREVSVLINQYLNPLLNKVTSYPYIEHYKRTHKNVPLWVLVKALTFGTLSKMYKFSKFQVQSMISKEYAGLNEAKLSQVLEVLTDFRNVCAHNERLFSHKCAKKDIPDLLLHRKLRIKKNGQEYSCGKRDYFSVVIAFRYMLDKKDFLIYKKELVNLILKVTKETHQIPIERLLGLMGMPVNWKDITRYTHI